MINQAEMVSKVAIEVRLRVLTDQEIQSNLRSKIDAIKRSVELPIRIGRPYGILGEDNSRFLFLFKAEEFSFLRRDSIYPERVGRVESDRLQRLGLEVMKEYGLDEKVSRPPYHDRGWTKDGVIDDRNGNSREMMLYPSQTIDGLAFVRTREFIKATGQTLSVGWSVLDKAPLFRIKLRKK